MQAALRAAVSAPLLSAVALCCLCGGGVVNPCVAPLGVDERPVFVGKVIEVTDMRQGIPAQFLSSRKVRLQVTESFGGLPAGTREVELFTGLGGGDCGISFKTGETYLVNAFIWKDGRLHTSMCDGTRRVDSDPATPHILRQRRDGTMRPSLIGEIGQRELNFTDRNRMWTWKPLPDILVRVMSDGRTYETRSGGDGVFMFRDLPRGMYSFPKDLPPGTWSSWIAPDRPPLPVPVTGGSCFVHRIVVTPDGSIHGRVLDPAGRLIPDEAVYIIPADQDVPLDRDKLQVAMQSEDGHYKFTGIPPGRYLIVVNPSDARDSKLPYRRTFYPGVPDRESASIVTVQNGEPVTNIDIHLLQ